MTPDMQPTSSRTRWVYLGLFLTTFCTLLIEILDTRLLSVVTWYHLSFLAVSLAMLGMAAGAVHVFLAGPSLSGDTAVRRLPTIAIALAVVTAVSHLVSLAIPIPSLNQFSVMEVVAVAAATIVLALPFYSSGVTVTVALTRLGGSIGRLYAADLAGAATACLVVVPLLDSSWFNVSSLVFLAAAAAAAGAACFARYAGRSTATAVTLAAALLAAALWNGSRANGIDVAFPKNRQFWMAASTYDQTRWNSHSYVILQRPVSEPVFLWGPGRQTPDVTTEVAWIAIDGEAGTPITQWDGNPSTLDWVRHDVTTLPYYLRRGSAAVIGVGGGRDILSAIWGRSDAVTGIEVNGIELDILNGSRRSFARIADQPGVRLVHDDARAFLTRTDAKFDVIQMSLIDTWASTGAGAFTLSENGLYTIEAWRVFLSRLTPTGVFSVSRWFAPENVSETNRLLSLAIASLIDRQVRNPLEHVLLVTRGRTATLLTCASPLTAEDEQIVRRVAADEEFTIQVSPWTGGANAVLDHIARSRSVPELLQATANPDFDYRPPTDERPFFFNMLKPGSFTRVYSLPRGGVIWGNMRATATLVLLFLIASLLVVAIIVVPLVRQGWPEIPRALFGASLLYFTCIGFGFMFVQIALLQRFSIFLGHPAYTLSVTLFAMILFAGLGSYASDALQLSRRTAHTVLPLVAAATIVIVAVLVQPVTDMTIRFGLHTRAAVVVGLLAPVSVLLGFFFPTGLRLVFGASTAVTAWMWGVNGAAGVLGSIVAVGISMWVGIQANLFAAATLYAFLVVPLAVMQRARSSEVLPVSAGIR